MKTKLFYGLVLVAALWINSTFAQSGYEGAITDACARHGCDSSQLIRVMYCESGGDPTAYNAVTGDEGLFQINNSIWGVGVDPYAQIEFAAHMFATGQGYFWICQ